jgi:hypothetical protein
MSLSTMQRRELFTALDELRNATLSDEQEQAVQALVTNEEEARQLYVEHMFLVATLRWTYGDPAIVGERNQDPITINTAHSASQVLNTVRPKRTLRLTPRMVGLAASLLLIGYFVTVVGLLAWDRMYRTTTHNQFASDFSEPAAVATIRDAVDVQWSKHTAIKLANSPVHAGEPLKISSGTIELELKAGAQLVVEGPADWSVNGHNSISLRAGKVWARVPKQAIGFTVETPTAEVVDLGTEFAVEADQQGTEVQVFQGKVELHPGSKVNHSERPITLTAGEGRRIEIDGKNGVNITNVLATPDSFTRHTSLDPTSSRQIRIEGAYASSTCKDPQFDVRYLIDGQGLQGDRHSADPHNSMWRSRLGEVKNVCVSFDLGGVRRVESMKVWNFNAAQRDEYRYRGVKQADIYASTSGKGDPLSEPHEWKLVVADQQFAAGDGTANYATPTSVSLGDVETRFVAIVIDEALGINPNLTRPYGATEKVHFGSLSTITDVSSLDLSGTFPYALELGYSKRSHRVAGVAFTDPKATSGVKLNMGNLGAGGIAFRFGADADNKALEAILSHSLFTNVESLTGSVELAVSPGKAYKLQLLYNETYPETTRVQNLAINGSAAVTRLVQMVGVPRVYTHQFVSTGDTLTIEFSAGEKPGADNDIWTQVSGLTLELISADEHASNAIEPNSKNRDIPSDCVGLSEVQFFGNRVEPASQRGSP